jgi:cation-transporting ATPase E
VPAGLVIAIALTIDAWAATGAGIRTDELRTGSTLILTIVGLWVLIVLSRPIDGWKILVIGSMMIGLILVYSIPFIREFLVLVDTSLTTSLLVLVVSTLTIGAIEIIRFVHRRYVKRNVSRARSTAPRRFRR